MDYIKTFKDFINESIVNESSLDLHGYVKKAADRAQDKGGNGVNISDYGAFELAGSLESYYKQGKGDGNIYTDKTIKLFKQLIDSMVDDEIKNNQVDESLNESKLTGKETDYNTKQFNMYFQNKYGYISHSLSSKELEKFLKQDIIKKVSLEKAADYFQDYLLANGLADVQESEVNEGKFGPAPKHPFMFQIFARKKKEDEDRESHRVSVTKNDDLDEVRDKILKDYPRNKYFYVLYRKARGGYINIGTNESEEMTEAAGTLQDKYDALIKALEKAKVPCRVKLTSDEVIIECGWNYPDRIADKVFDAADLVGLKDSEISVSAEHSGPGIKDTTRVLGGPKRY